MYSVLSDFLFADDCALNARNEQKMQTLIHKFSSACDNCDLTISTEKKNKSRVPASTKLSSHWAIHHSEQRTAEKRAQFHLPW